MSSPRLLLLLALLVTPAASFAGDDEETAPAGDEVDLLRGTADAPEAPLSLDGLPELSPLPSTESVAGVEAVRLLSDALDRIAALEILLASSADGVDRDQALVELAEVRRSLHSALVEVGRLKEDGDLRAWLLAEGLLTAPVEEPVGVAETEAPAEPGLPSERFVAIVATIEGVSFTEGKMQVLTRELEQETVTSEQAAALVELFSFSRDRVDALVFLHPRLVDQENFEQLLSSLKFESDRETVRNTLGLEG